MFLIRQNSYRKTIIVLFSIIYAIILWWFTLHRKTPDSNLTNYLIPFSSFWQITQLRWAWSGEYLFRAIVGNMVLFIPVGIFVTVLKKKYLFLLSGTIGFFVSLAIELIQLSLSLGSFEADDLISNTWGAVIGSSIAIMILNRHENVKQRIFILIPLISFATLIVSISFVPICKEIIRLL